MAGWTLPLDFHRAWAWTTYVIIKVDGGDHYIISLGCGEKIRIERSDVNEIRNYEWEPRIVQMCVDLKTATKLGLPLDSGLAP